MRKLYSILLHRLICCFLFFFIISNNSKAADIYVPTDYSTIQAAIDAAQSGDIIHVLAGTYTETLSVKAGITLKGAGFDVTFIDGSGTGNESGSIIRIDGADCSIEGFTIKNSNLDTNGNLGAGIDGNGYNFSARNNRIMNCRIGIRVISSSSNIIERNVIQDNPGLCGIAANYSTGVQILNNTIYNSGRGIQYTGSSSLKIINNIVKNNFQYGIVSFDNVVAEIRFNDVWNNTYNYYNIADQTNSNGNISSDPMFMNEYTGDFNLSEISPCIDAGDPSSPQDRDATTADIGALYYNQTELSIGIIGTSLSGWDTDVDMQTTDKVHYTLSDYSLAAGMVKFRKNNTWIKNWGNISFPSGTGTQDGSNIPIPAGTYNISFNKNTGEYNFECVECTTPTIGIIGAAVSPDGVTEIKMNTADGNIFTLDNISLATGVLHFIQDSNPDIEWGGNGFPS